MTNEAKHTPGPWNIRKENSVSAEFVESGDDQIAMLCDGDDKTRKANACLIAAAPDMFDIHNDSIEILEIVLGEREEVKGEEDEILRDLITRIKTVVAKAEGR